HCHAAGAVPLVRDFLIVDAFELTRALLDRALDVVLRHRAGLRGIDGGAQPGVAIRVAATLLRGDRDFADQLREQRTALRVSRGLVVLDLLPFAMACHTP